MLPSSPDRFAPRLQEILPVNQIRLDLFFDEEINHSILTHESFLITATDFEETLKIRTVIRGTNSNIITIYTEPTRFNQYQISGVVEDRFANIARINRKFMPSLIIDTFPPRITLTSPKVGATKRNRNIFFEFGFSEPIDTTVPVSFIVYPLDKSKITWQYSNDWQTLTFGYSTRGKPGEVFIDSLGPDTNVYFVLQPNLTDLSGNRLQNCGYTFFTTESILPPIIVSGNLYFQNQPYSDGIIIFSNQNNKAMTVSDGQGNFAVRLDSVLYKVTAIKDTNFDNFVDLYAELTNFNPLDTIPIKLYLQPILEGREIDYYLR